MKTVWRFILIFLAAYLLLVLLREGFRGVSPQDSSLEIRLRLSETGPEITDQVTYYVGVVPEGRRDEPRLGNVRLIRPDTKGAHVYQVPRDRPVGVFVLSRGVPHFRSVVTVESGRRTVHDFVLNAGVVNVHFVGQHRARVWYLDKEGGYDPKVKASDGARFMVPAGPQRFQAGEGVRAAQVELDVAAGEQHDLNIDYTLGLLTVEIDSALPAARLQGLRLETTKEGARVNTRIHAHSASSWQYGEYEATLVGPGAFYNWGGSGRLDLRQVSVGPIPMTIDQPETHIRLTLPLIGVAVRAWEWPKDAAIARVVLVVSMSDAGLPFAAARLKNADTPALVFPAPKVAHSYAIAVLEGDRVVALQPVGPLAAETMRTVQLKQGGDPALCREILPKFACDGLRR